MIYTFRPPLIQKLLYRDFLWEGEDKTHCIYLTFDDGPVTGVTEYVLEILDQFQAEGTFFMTGANVKKNSDLVLEVSKSGHAIGNHTYDHVNGWKCSDLTYMDNMRRCDEALSDVGIFTKLFRPPYGRIKFSQARLLDKQKIMWSFLTGDFDNKLNVKDSLWQMKKEKTGSILVFHDTFKSFNNLKLLLPEALKYFKDQGYQFKMLPQ